MNFNLVENTYHVLYKIFDINTCDQKLSLLTFYVKPYLASVKLASNWTSLHSVGCLAMACLRMVVVLPKK